MRPLLPGLCLLLLAGAVGAPDGGEPEGLGTTLRQDGYSIRPPSGFRMARMDLFRGTRVGAVAATPYAPGWLSAALVDGEGDDAATVLVSVVEGSLLITPAAREDFAAAAVRHFADELGLRLSMERAELINGPLPRVEVLGSVRQENQLRRVLVAGMAGEGRHAVVIFTAPSGRWEELWPRLRSSLESFRNEGQAAYVLPRSVAGGVALGVGAALLASVALWRRRKVRERFR